jgi:hypothetical protein
MHHHTSDRETTLLVLSLRECGVLNRVATGCAFLYLFIRRPSHVLGLAYISVYALPADCIQKAIEWLVASAHGHFEMTIISFAGLTNGCDSCWRLNESFQTAWCLASGH